jgi:hypothetical protein
VSAPNQYRKKIPFPALPSGAAGNVAETGLDEDAGISGARQPLQIKNDRQMPEFITL